MNRFVFRSVLCRAFDRSERCVLEGFCTSSTDVPFWYVSNVLFEDRRVGKLHKCRRLLFNRPVDRSRSICTVDKDPPTWEYGGYRRSIRIHLLWNAVDIDGRWGFTYLKIRSIFDRPSISPKNRSKSTVDMDSYPKKIGRYRPSMSPHHTKKICRRSISTVEVDMDSKKSWTLTSLTHTS